MAAIRILDLLDLQPEVDRADDAIAEFLMDQRLQRRAIDLHHLVEAIERRISRNTIRKTAAQRHRLKQPDLIGVEVEALADDLRGVLRQRMLAEQSRRHELAGIT